MAGRVPLTDKQIVAGILLRKEKGMSIPQISKRVGGTPKGWEYHFRKNAIWKLGRPPTRLPKVSEHDEVIWRLRHKEEWSIGRIGVHIGKPEGYVAQRLQFIAIREAAIDALAEAREYGEMEQAA